MKIIGVIGAGTMGSGIALASALAGFHVILYDIAEPTLQRAAKSNSSQIDKAVEKGKLKAEEAQGVRDSIKTSTTFEDLAPCDLIIEAAVENLKLKQELFSKLSNMLSEDAIL